MAIDFDKLEKTLSGAAADATKRAALAELADSNEPRARKILETLARDKSTAIKLLASSYLKKNFSDAAAAASQPSDTSHGHAAQQVKTAAVPVSGGAAAGGDIFQKIFDADFVKYVVAPLGVIAILGLFSPAVPAFFFFSAYLALIITVSLYYDKQIAIPAILVICLIAMLFYAMGLIVNFRPTFLLMAVFTFIGSYISIVATDLREKNINSRSVIEDLKSQIMQLKKLIDKRKDFDETQKDMDVITKMKNDLNVKSRRLGETLIQIHELISNQKTDEIIDRVTKLFTRQIGAKSVSVWVSNPKFHSIYPLGCSEKHIDPQRYMNMNISLEEETIITKVSREGGFYTGEELRKISEYEPFSKEFDIKSEFSVSMDAGNKIIGVINCEEVFDTFELNDETKKLIKLIADVAAWALKNAGDLELSKRDLQNIKQLSDKEREEKKKIRSIFDKFVSPKVIEEIMNNPASLSLGGKRRAITMFFADIRGFTSMSETLAGNPEVVLDIVNRFHSAMTDIILANGGTIDKYIGDALMALFGAPMSTKVEDDAYNTIAAAITIKNECGKIREQLIREGKTAVNVGIGINTGDVVVGMVGSTKMMNYTAIGDAVNTAARIEANAGAGQVLISRATYELVKDRVQVKTLDAIMVKGKREPVEIFEVMGLK